MTWSLVIMVFSFPNQLGGVPPTVAFQQLDFATEQMCSSAKAKLAVDWRTTLSGANRTDVIDRTYVSCVQRQ
jgi:hypothetical protein